MNHSVMTLARCLVAAAGIAALCLGPAEAQTATKKTKPAAKTAVPKKKPAPAVLPAADAEQIEASKLVFYGHYECEFKQAIEITADEKHPSYVGVTHGKASYLMKPVLSSTGAIRLEDVKGETLMVQISNKSMLLNVKAGHRIVDDCITQKQRDLMEAAAKVKAAEAAEAAASAASAAAQAAAAAAVAASAASAAALAASEAAR
jgi:hypothetical protein